jgi:1-acyl-sn-glycerol-3-phosphate acyltransferase
LHVIVCSLIGTIWVAGVVFLSFVLSFCTQLLAYPLLYLYASERTMMLTMGRIFRGWSGLVIYLNPMWSFRIVGKTSVTSLKHTVVMCNHLSNADPFFLCTALWPWETKYLAKKSLFSIPFGGWAMTLAGDICIYFTKAKGGWGIEKGRTGPMLKHCERLVNIGVPICVFPEGARSKTGEMRDLKNGMFIVATQAEQAEVLPVAIWGTNKAWGVTSVLMDWAQVEIAIGEPVSCEDEDIESLKELVDARIKEARATLPSYRAWRERQVAKAQQQQQEEKSSAAVADAAAVVEEDEADTKVVTPKPKKRRSSKKKNTSSKKTATPEVRRSSRKARKTTKAH